MNEMQHEESWQARAERAEAQCAVMREALEAVQHNRDCSCYGHSQAHPCDRCIVGYDEAEAALSTDAGSALLKELRNAKDDRDKLLMACDEVTDALGFERDSVWPTDAPLLVKEALKELKALRDALENLLPLINPATSDYDYARRDLVDTATAAQEYEKRIRREAALEMRERCAKKADDRAALLRSEHDGAPTDEIIEVEEIAAAIRALGTEE